MRQTVYIILACIISYLFFSFTLPNDDEKTALITIGSKAPLTDYQMVDISGKKLSLSDVNNEHGLLVIFSCNNKRTGIA